MPAFSTTISYEDNEYGFSLFCDLAGQPHFGRFRIDGLTEDVIPERCLPIIQITKEHLLTVLRLFYQLDANLFPLQFWSFFKDGIPHDVNLRVEPHRSHAFDPQATRALFELSIGLREELRLFADGSDPRLPLQYRLLSLYKVLETRFKHRGQWKKAALEAQLAPYSSRLREVDGEKSPAALLHDMRDRCAHIKVGRKKEARGVTPLNHREMVKAEKLLPILVDVCRAVVNEAALGKVVVTPIPAVIGEGNAQPGAAGDAR